MMPLVITESPRLTSYSSHEFSLHLAGNPDLSPCMGDATCCALDHVVVVNGNRHQIACDKLFMGDVLNKMCKAKMDALVEQQLWPVVLYIGAAWPTLVASSPEALADARADVVRLLWDCWGRPGEELKTNFGMSPWHTVALMNDVGTAREMPLDASITDGCPLDVMGSTPITHCAIVGSVEA